MMRRYRDSDYVISWFDNGLDIETRTIYMGSMSNVGEGESGVDNFMAENFIKGMHILESKSLDKEIFIIMNNPGGDWYHGMAIYDAIKNSPCHCTIKVYGHAMSMGSVILQAADQRIMMPNSRFMIHYGTDSIDSHSKNVSKWAEEYKKINSEMEEIYIERMMEKMTAVKISKYSRTLNSVIDQNRLIENKNRSNVTYTFSRSLKSRADELLTALQELLNFDTILTADETVELGFADLVYKKTN